MAEDTYPQLATYWAPSSLDGYGNRSFGTPTTLKVQWEERTDLVIMSNDERKPSKAVVYVRQDVTLGGYLALGDQTATSDPETLNDANLIMGFESIPSIDGKEFTKRALL